jgi:hypothetical protein
MYAIIIAVALYTRLHKVDNIRTIAIDGIVRSRAMEPLPNRFIADYFAKNAQALEGLDGELVVLHKYAHEYARNYPNM